MNPEQQEEQSIIQKLQAQKNAVKPQQALLTRIIAQLPAEGKPWTFAAFMQEQRTLTWIRFAVPAVFAALITGIFFITQYSQTPSAPSAPTPAAMMQQMQRPLAISAIEAEEEQIEQQLTFEDFFADELQMQEIDTTLAAF